MISTTVSNISYSGNASATTPYSIPFPFLANADISVTVTDAAGTSTPLVNGSTFTVSNITDSNGRITGGSLITSTAYASTYTVAIKRDTAALQETDFVQSGNISAEVLESAIDRAIMVSQDTARDATITGTSNISAAGTGIVAQTASDVFSTRTISPGSNTPLTITDGDGVAGNPTITYDSSGLTAITSINDSSVDTVQIDQAGALKEITVDNLANELRPLYASVYISPNEIAAGASSNPPTLTDVTLANGTAVAASYDDTTAKLGYFLWRVPDDYAGGAVMMKITQHSVNLASGGTSWVWRIATDQVTDLSTTFTAAPSYTNYTETTSGSTALSQAMALGSSHTAGGMTAVFIQRDPTDGSDDKVSDICITGIQIQYPTKRVTAAWA